MCSVSLLKRVALFSSLKLNCQLHPFSIHQNKNQGLWSVNWWIWGIPLGGLFRLWIFEVSRFSRVFSYGLCGPSWFGCRPLPHKKPPSWEWQWWFRTICKSLAFFLFFSVVWDMSNNENINVNRPWKKAQRIRLLLSLMLRVISAPAHPWWKSYRT